MGLSLSYLRIGYDNVYVYVYVCVYVYVYVVGGGLVVVIPDTHLDRQGAAEHRRHRADDRLHKQASERVSE